MLARTPFSNQSLSVKFATVFGASYCLLLTYCYFFHYRDPTSAFFNKTRAFDLRYSAVREQESDVFIDTLIQSDAPQPKVDPTITPDLCIGVATHARVGAQYFRYAVGSLLAGLDASERARFHLVLFPTHVDPKTHPAENEGWIPKVADTVLRYNASNQDLLWIESLENMGGSSHVKSMVDYTYLLEACSDTGAEYIMMIEDDVLALDGWYHRTRAALREVRENMQSRLSEKFLYLRLFYTEKFLGWQSAAWPTYLFNSALLSTCGVGLGIYVRRAYFPKSSSSTTSSSTATISFLFQILFYMALTIGLFFAAGRASVLPPRNGVREWSKNACCSQGMVFPRDAIPELVDHLRTEPEISTDSSIERYAEKSGGVRWALIPSILQHVGRQSTRPDRSTSWTIFNAVFESNNAAKLRKEHQSALFASNG